jgi:cysteine desulfurase/selenocysteine lyase
MTGAAVEAEAPGTLSSEFGPFHGRVWLNCAHQGPLPRSAREAALEALEQKRTPARISDDLFAAVPARLRGAVARLIGADSDDIALTNSTSYGFNVLAHGLPWQEGDEVLCVAGDFPATVVPWLPLRRRGVRIRLLELPGARVTAEDLERAITSRTRVVAVSWVFSFFGHAVDLEDLGRVCRSRGVLLVVNGSQAVGARSLDVNATSIDALSACGFKWLCGPYATGFLWVAPHVRARLRYEQPHWLRLQIKSADAQGVDLNRELDYMLTEETTADAYDVFCAANFLNFIPWTAAIEHLLEVGVDRIAAHDQALVDRLLASVPETYETISPREGAERSTLVLLTHRESERNEGILRGLLLRGIDVAFRDNKLRFSPHLYNDAADIDVALAALAELG